MTGGLPRRGRGKLSPLVSDAPLINPKFRDCMDPTKTTFVGAMAYVSVFCIPEINFHGRSRWGSRIRDGSEIGVRVWNRIADSESADSKRCQKSIHQADVLVRI